jgi:hypothetical protein
MIRDLKKMKKEDFFQSPPKETRINKFFKKVRKLLNL